MKNLPAVRFLMRILVNPGWAPLGVVAMHLVLAEFGLTQRFDHLLHFTGGAAMAWFLFGLIALLPFQVTGVPKWVHHLIAFSSACTVAVFWEFAEFASDQLLGTAIQQSLSETVLDLLFGVLGAGATLLMAAAFSMLVRGVAPENPAHQGTTPDGNSGATEGPPSVN